MTWTMNSSVMPAVLLWSLLGSASVCLASSQQIEHEHPPHVASQGQAAAPAQGRVKDPLELEADKRFSEFNHRFAGVFVLLVGLLALLELQLAKRVEWVRYLWSLLFFLPGVYLLIWSDPESWPTGNQSLHYVITQNMQVLQHKIFSLLLLGLAAVELIRVRKNLRSVWVSSIFPVLTGLGALLLLYHSPQAHAAGMDASAHLEMQKIAHQHIGFAVVGFGIAISKAFADIGRFRPRLMRNLFAVLMVVLAILLIAYTE